MQPDAVAEFIRAFAAETNAQRGDETVTRTRQETERAALKRKLDGLYDAIAEGLRTPGLKEKLEELEARVAALDNALTAPAPPPVRLLPNLSELYRRKVTELATTLGDPAIRTPALELVWGLIEQVTVRIDGAGNVMLDLEGALTAMLDLAQPGAVRGLWAGSAKVVAGARSGLCLPTAARGIRPCVDGHAYATALSQHDRISSVMSRCSGSPRLSSQTIL